MSLFTGAEGWGLADINRRRSETRHKVFGPLIRGRCLFLFVLNSFTGSLPKSPIKLTRCCNHGTVALALVRWYREMYRHFSSKNWTRQLMTKPPALLMLSVSGLVLSSTGRGSNFTGGVNNRKNPFYIVTPVELPYIFCTNELNFTSKILEDNALFLQVSWKKMSDLARSCEKCLNVGRKCLIALL